MLKVIIAVLIAIGIVGHFVPFKSYEVRDAEATISSPSTTTKKYRIVSGGNITYKEITTQKLCTEACGNANYQLYLW